MSEALVVYEAEKKNGRLITTAEIFHTNVERLKLGQDAVDRWLRDPDKPEQYDIGPRAEEVTVHYEELEWIGDDVPPIRRKRKGKLHTMLGGIAELNGIRVTGFETKFADPRRLLTEYSESLRGEIGLFVQAWNAWQEQQREEEMEQQRRDADAVNLQTLFEEALGGDQLKQGLVPLLETTGVSHATALLVAEKIAPGLLSLLVAAFAKRTEG